MKKILFVLSFLVSVVCYGQTVPGYTPVNDRYIHEGLMPKGLASPATGDTALRSGQSRRAGQMMLDTTGVDTGFYIRFNNRMRKIPFTTELGNGVIDSIWRVDDVDTIYWRQGGITYAVKDSVGGGGLSGGNLGSNYRLYNPSAQGIKTLASDGSLEFDTTFANTMTIRLKGDQAVPGNNKFYGTNGSGTRGYYDVSTIGGQNFGKVDTTFTENRHVNGQGLYNFLFDSIPDFQINDAAGNNRFQIANVRTKLFSASGNSSIEMGDTMSFTAPQFHITDLPAATTTDDKTVMVYDTSTTHWQRMEFTPLDTTGRYAAGDSSLIYYDTTTKTFKHIAFADVGGSGSGTPAGNTTNIQLNRNGAFAAAGSDSLTWIANGLNIKGRYMVDGASVVYQPDQSGTEFLNSIFFGSLPASLNNGSGIQAQYLTGVGKLALNANTTGASTVAVGSRSLQANTTGNNNVAVGDGPFIANTSGSNNVGVGMAAGSTNSTGSNITAVGFESLRMNTASTNTAYAYRSLHENTSGGSNVGLGPDAGYQNQTGSFNTWVGASSGTGAGSSSNSNNTGVGYQSGFANSTGGNNIFFGYRAGDNNTTESNKIVIGYDVDAPSGSNTATIGNFLFATGVTGTGTTAAGSVGIGVIPSSISARLHLPAGTATAGTAPEKSTSGTLLTTPEVGAREYNNAHYLTNNALNRFGYGGVILSNSSSVSNSGTSVTTLSTYTTKANTLAATEEAIYFEYHGEIDDASPVSLVVSFAGTNIALFAPAGTATFWNITGKIVRTGASTATAMTTYEANNVTIPVLTKLTGLTFSGTNVLLLTGESTTGNTDAIVKEIARIKWEPAAAN